MKAIKIWIAQHPEDPQNREVRFDEPDEASETCLGPYADLGGTFVPWVEHACIPLES